MVVMVVKQALQSEFDTQKPLHEEKSVHKAVAYACPHSNKHNRLFLFFAFLIEKPQFGLPVPGSEIGLFLLLL